MPLKTSVGEYPNFPKPGILFRDVTPLLENRFHEVLDALISALPEQTWQDADAIAGVEARGFTLAAGLAGKLGKNMVQIRKSGKLPGVTERVSYELEYGQAELEMQHGSGKVIIIDDVLATGGTLKAAATLCEKTGREVIDFLVLVDITALNQFEWNGIKAKSILQY
jgi:adenine phosphoribosyltransferase